MFWRKKHTHPTFWTLLDDGLNPFKESDINQTVKDMLTAIAKLRQTVQRQAHDLAAIHAAYRAQYCGDCCHDAICEKKASIKYGDKCDKREVNCPKRMMP